MVEMDTMENEEKVLKKKIDIRNQNPELDHVGIRKAKYKELWKMVEELTVVKRVVNSGQNDINDNEIGELCESFVRKRALVKYQSQSY